MNRDIQNRLQDPQQLSGMLRRLPARVPPAGLTTSLRVIASRERVRVTKTRLERFQDFLRQLEFTYNNLMRPLALPAAGGFFSAAFLFSTFLVPAYPLRVASGLDVPTILKTEATVRGTIAVGIGSSGVAIVEVTIDDVGRMVDYKVVEGGAALTDVVLRRRLENTLLFTEFIPATSFGMPVTTSVVRVSVGLDSRIEVKG